MEKEAGLQVVFNTGGVQFAKKDEMSHVIDAYAKAMKDNCIRYQNVLNMKINMYLKNCMHILQHSSGKGRNIK